jgi:hypothetical protein
VTTKELIALATQTKMPTAKELRELTAKQRVEYRKVQALRIKQHRARQKLEQAKLDEIHRMTDAQLLLNRFRRQYGTTFREGRARLKAATDEMWGR